MFDYEQECLNKNYKLIAGMDEAGRGPLAGAVFTAMVIMPLDKDKIIPGINDSKKLTPQKRELLYEKIKSTAIDYCVCSVDENKIDEINILNATILGMQNCIQKIKTKPDICLVDYVAKLSLDCDFKTIVKGDAVSYSIACASILAKVERDRYITQMANIYPNYNFEKHKGYGTKLHYQKLSEFGASPIHRKSFLKKLEIN